TCASGSDFGGPVINYECVATSHRAGVRAIAPEAGADDDHHLCRHRPRHWFLDIERIHIALYRAWFGVGCLRAYGSIYAAPVGASQVGTTSLANRRIRHGPTDR